MVVTSLREEYYKDLVELVKQVVGNNDYMWKDKGGMYYQDIYADYRDELSDKQIKTILSSKDPEVTFTEIMDDIYVEEETNMIWDVIESCTEDMAVLDMFEKYRQSSSETRKYPMEDVIRDIVQEIFYVNLPLDHYYDQDVHLNIIIDSGDANYDFACNNILNYCGDYSVDGDSSILWLCKQQGKEEEFFEMLEKLENNEEYETEDKFLVSVKEELENLTSSIGALVFCAECSLEKAIQIQKLINSKKGKLILKQNQDYNCGLYDAWNGGGSLLNICLDKPIELPVNMVHSALPDGADGRYSINEIYAPINIWREGEVVIENEN